MTGLTGARAGGWGKGQGCPRGQTDNGGGGWAPEECGCGVTSSRVEAGSAPEAPPTQGGSCSSCIMGALLWGLKRSSVHPVLLCVETLTFPPLLPPRGFPGESK